MAKKQSERKEEIKGVSIGNDIGGITLSHRFALLNKMITRDLNNNTTAPTFSKYTRNDIATYIANPYRYEKQLRDAIEYIYAASPHFRRLIQYFVGLSDLSYIISPFRIDPGKANKKTVNGNYRKVMNTMSIMSVKTQFPKILTVCLREDVFYGTLRVTADNITIQQLPSDYCAIASVEGNVPNVTFDFSYFQSRKNMLEFYPEEFQRKYRLYENDRVKNRYQELEAPYSFAVKCNMDILDYAAPPFAGMLREIYNLEDYKDIMLSRAAVENYALLAMKLPMDDEGNWLLDYDKAKDFWQNLDAVMPEDIGSVLTPMPIEKISFERSKSGEDNTIANAEESLYSAAGVQSQLFNNSKA